MGFLNFLATLILIFLAFRLVWMLVWPYVTRWLLRRVQANLQEQMRRQQNAQQQNYRPYEQEIRFDGGISATMPPETRKSEAGRAANLSQVAEDVDFEEVEK